MHIVLGWRHIFWIILDFWFAILIITRSKDIGFFWSVAGLVYFSLSMCGAIALLLGG